MGQAVLKGSDVATKVGTLRGSVARSMRDEVARLLNELKGAWEEIGTYDQANR